MANIIRVPSGGAPDFAVIHTYGGWDHPTYKSSYTYTTEKDYRQLIVSFAVGADRDNKADVQVDHGEQMIKEIKPQHVGGVGGLDVTAILGVYNDVPAGTKITVKGYYVRTMIIAGAE